MTDKKVIGCKEGSDNFYCVDCKFRDGALACLEHRLSWELKHLHEDAELIFASDEDEINATALERKCVQLGEVLI